MDEKNIQELMLIYGMKSTEELVAISGNAESSIEKGIATKIINERKRQEYIDLTIGKMAQEVHSIKGIQSFFCLIAVLGMISTFILIIMSISIR